MNNPAIRHEIKQILTEAADEFPTASFESTIERLDALVYREKVKSIFESRDFQELRLGEVEIPILRFNNRHEG